MVAVGVRKELEEMFFGEGNLIYLKFVFLLVSCYCVKNIYHVFTGQPTGSEVIRTQYA